MFTRSLKRFDMNSLKTNQLLLVDRTICEMSSDGTNEQLLATYFDLKPNTYATEIDTTSMEILDNLKNSIKNEVNCNTCSSNKKPSYSKYYFYRLPVTLSSIM